MKSNEYRNLLFDFGNVIIDIDIPGTEERMKKLFKKGATRDAFNEVINKYESGKVSTDIFINSLLSQCGPQVQALDIIEGWNSMLIGIPQYRLDMLKALREKYNVYLLSNTNELHIEWVRRYFFRIYGERDFEKTYFDGVYYSHLIKDRKPNASIYQFVINDALLTPSATLFMDDVEENILAAHAVGLGTYHVQENEEIAEYLKLEGFY